MDFSKPIGLKSGSETTYLKVQGALVTKKGQSHSQIQVAVEGACRMEQSVEKILIHKK